MIRFFTLFFDALTLRPLTGASSDAVSHPVDHAARR